PGYRRTVWSDLTEAARLDVPGKDTARLRAEILACLGDPIGLDPVKASDADRAEPPPIPPDLDRVMRTVTSSPTAVQAGWRRRGAGRELIGAIAWHKYVAVLHNNPVGIRTTSPLGVVYDLALTPDGEMVVAGCEEGVVSWSTRTPMTVRSLCRCGN